jgi:thiosulfate/3-mercaptopyruvate sulfurtransferase
MRQNPAVPVRPIISTDWLEEHLRDADLRILDCHARSRPRADGRGHVFESGCDHYDRGHIPGAVFADLVGELSRHDTELPLMLPGPEQFAAAMGGYGVGDGVRVVLYDASIGLWAARVWWMLRAYGFTAASVLDGGWRKWRLEGRPVSMDVPAPAPARFVPRPQLGLNASRADVRSALADPAARVVNALEPALDSIEGSGSLPGVALVDPETNAFLPRERLRELAEETGLLAARRVVTYCDAGALASLDALMLSLVGRTDVAVYDGSLAEWRAQARPDR